MIATANTTRRLSDYVGQQESGDQGQNDAEDGDSVSEDRGPSRGNTGCGVGGGYSHKKNPIPVTGNKRVTGVHLICDGLPLARRTSRRSNPMPRIRQRLSGLKP